MSRLITFIYYVNPEETRSIRLSRTKVWFLLLTPLAILTWSATSLGWYVTKKDRISELYTQVSEAERLIAKSQRQFPLIKKLDPPLAKGNDVNRRFLFQ